MDSRQMELSIAPSPNIRVVGLGYITRRISPSSQKKLNVALISPLRRAGRPASHEPENLHKIVSRLIEEECRHIVCGFSLRSGNSQRSPRIEEYKFLMALFPDTIAITFSAPFLVVRCRKLPPMPWPISIAGVPLWFTKDLAALPIEFGMPGLGREVSFTSAVLSHLKVHTAEFESLMIILRYRFNVEILSILWTGNRYLITVPGVTEIRRLPENMMGLLITYKYADDEDRISAVVAHRKLANVVRDDTDYTPHLRPGVMMSCETDDGQELLMTSGIPVRDPQDGQVYITTTTHNKTFPPGEQKVWHSTGSHSEIGKVQRALGHTGISLIRLHAGISYGQGTFGNIPLRYMREPDIPVGDHVFFNSPFSGYCDGIVSAVEFRRTPGPYWSTVTVLWIYVGQEPMEDLCGSAVWDKQGNVVALFRCADKNIKNGFALATSVLPLIKAGMQICKAEQWIW